MTVEDVVANLTARGIYPNFVAWYNNFFGTNGDAAVFFT
jgi:hypothetical protein